MKKVTAFILALTMLSFPIAGLCAGASVWAEAEVEEAIEKGFVPEELRKSYQSEITRGEFAKMAMLFAAWNLGYTFDEFKALVERKFPETPAFSDTNDEYAALAARCGVIYGEADSLFEPERAITREEAACMLTRLYDAYSMEFHRQDLEFEDTDEISQWAVDDVRFCVGEGVMKGVSETRFDPKGTFTREQAILTFLRLGKVETWKKMNVNTDLRRKMTREELIDAYFAGNSYWSKDEVIETPYGTAICMHTSGIPHAPSYIICLFDDTPEIYSFGTNVFSTAWGSTPKFENITLSEDGEKITFTQWGCRFEINLKEKTCEEITAAEAE